MDFHVFSKAETASMPAEAPKKEQAYPKKYACFFDKVFRQIKAARDGLCTLRCNLPNPTK